MSLSLCLALLLFLPSAAHAATDPGRAVVDALSGHDVVLLAEEHSGIQFHGFLHELLADPRLAGRVNDIVVEFGNPLYQSVVDRYIAGEDVPLAEVRPAWRNTTQILVWDSPLYEGFLTWVRTINSGLPPEERYRVVLMDPPIDWAKVKGKGDYEPYAQRSRDQLSRIEMEVLSKHRKALVVVGGAHVVRRNMRSAKVDVPLESASLGDALGQKYPGRTYAIWTIPGNAALSRELAGERAPAIFNVAGSRFAGRTFGDVAPGGIMVKRLVDGKDQWVKLTSDDWPSIDRMADGLLFLGTRRTLAAPQPAVYSDPAYYAELVRRAGIMQDVYGIDFVSELREAAGKH